MVSLTTLNDTNTSNYVVSTSNILIIKANLNDTNTSNYIATTSNILVSLATLNDANTSNYVAYTSSNILISLATINNINSSNYVEYTSNIISKRITDLNTDMINENPNANNRFIVNDIYNKGLTVNGDLIINSNLIVYGNDTRLETIVYTTEKLEVINANNNSVAFMVQQNNDGEGDIFVASNQSVKVFNIANNGNVNITGIYKRDNRDVIDDTSNYVKYTSNILVSRAKLNDTNSSNYVTSTSKILLSRISDSNNILTNKTNLNNINTSNYVASISNIISKRITDLNTDMINEDPNANNRFIVNNIYNNNLEIAGDLKVRNLTITGTTTTTNTEIKITTASNFMVEQLNAVNVNNNSPAIMVQQKNISYDIFVASNLNTNVFNIKNNGDVNITGIYKKDNRDVILDTSNYVTLAGNVITQKLNNLTSNMKESKIYVDASVLHKYCPMQTHFNIYKKTEEKTKPGWQFVDEDIDNKILDNYNNTNSDTIDGFCIRIKPNYNTTKILINLNCHIGIDDGLNVGPGENPNANARPWGLRLYRKNGFNGVWEHVTGADSSILTIPGIIGTPPTTCWVSHNLGAGADLSSAGIANISGTYYDDALISDDYIYYTAKWCSILGIDGISEENLNAYYEEEGYKYNAKLYLNRPALLYEELEELGGIPGYKNSAIATSSWNVTEIWQGDLTNIPKGGFITKYSSIQTEINIYKKTFEKKQLENWEFMGLEPTVKDFDDIKDIFCVRIRPTHYTSKILIKINCNIGIGGTESTFWGIRLWRRIGEDGVWEHLSDADGYLVTNTEGEPIGTPCWITNSSGGYSDASASAITNVSGTYYDSPNVGGDSGAGVYVYYAAKWSAMIGSDIENGKTDIGGLLYLNRPQVIDEDDIYLNTPILSSSWNATEIWQQERAFIPGNVLICNNMSLQTLFNIYRDVVSKSGNGWRFIDNRIEIIRNKIQGFCIRIKLSHSTSKVLLNLSCHIGIDYGTNAKWWGLRLYRKIGVNGVWTHISDADGNNLTDNKGTSCWLSHNLGADTSTSSYFVANLSGSYCDLPGISTDYVYYTVKWCALLGDDMSDSKLYLNRPAYYNNNNSNNSAVLSSSWCIQEIWQLGTPYKPNAVDDTFFKIYNNDTIGVGVGNADGIYKLDVNGSVNANKYYNIAIDTTAPTNIIHGSISNSLQKINSINPIYYIDSNKSSNYTFELNNLQEKIPEIVNYTVSQPQKIMIDYMSIIPLLTRSIQELTEKIKEQQEEIRIIKLQLSPDQLGSIAIGPPPDD